MLRLVKTHIQKFVDWTENLYAVILILFIVFGGFFLLDYMLITG